MICLNGKQYTEEDYEGNKTGGWEYDFTEFSEADNALSPSKVEENPEGYVDYVPVKGAAPTTAGTQTTLDRRITDIEDTLADIIGGEA